MQFKVVKKSHVILSGAVVLFAIFSQMAFTPIAQAQAAASSTGITVHAHRIPAAYWDPCFATSCSAGTGPGVTMYFELDDSSGNFVRGGFADENGHTFSGLDPTQTYYVYPTNCYQCHGSTHAVIFKHWGNDSTDVPRAAKVGANLHAWFSCTNGCSGD